MPREPFRPRGLVSAEGIRLGPPPLARRLKGLRFCGGTGGEGWGTAAEERAASGKEARLDFCSLIIPRGRPSRPAWMECRAAGALPGMAVEGPRRSQPPAHSYLQALQRKTNDSLVSWVSSSFILNRVHSPCLSRGPCCFHGCVCDSPSAVLLVTSRFPKKKRK